MANARYIGNPAEDGIRAAREDARAFKQAEAAKNAARTLMLAAIERLTLSLGEVSEYLKDDQYLAAIGTLDGFDEHVANIKAGERMLRMADKPSIWRREI